MTATKQVDALFGASPVEKLIDHLQRLREDQALGGSPVAQQKPLCLSLPIPDAWLGGFVEDGMKSKIILRMVGDTYQGVDPVQWRAQIGGTRVEDTLATGEVVSLIKGVVGQAEVSDRQRATLAAFVSEAHTWGYKKATLPKRHGGSTYEPPEKLQPALYNLANG